MPTEVYKYIALWDIWSAYCGLNYLWIVLFLPVILKKGIISGHAMNSSHLDYWQKTVKGEMLKIELLFQRVNRNGKILEKIVLF